MNNKRREILRNAVRFLDSASNLISNALEQEEDCLDNMPENLQMSDRYEAMEAAIDHLEDASSLLDEAKDKIGEAIGR